MAKPTTKREELNLGSNGLRIPNLLTDSLDNPFAGTELSLSASTGNDLQIPKDWPQVARDVAKQFFFQEPIPVAEGEPTAETSITQVVNRVAEAWRWWGDSYGYFNRKTDALNFSNELKYILINRIAAPNLLHWQNLGVRQAYGLRGENHSSTYFVDFDTDNIFPTRDYYTHPVLLNVNSDQYLADFYIDATHPVWQNPELANHIIRLITIAQDISILISGYRSQTAAQDSIHNRHVSFGIVGVTDQLFTNALIAEAIGTSSEIANIIAGNLEASNSAMLQLDKIQQQGYMQEYSAISVISSMVKRYGVRNFIETTSIDDQISKFVDTPGTIRPRPLFARETVTAQIKQLSEVSASSIPSSATAAKPMESIVESIVESITVPDLVNSAPKANATEIKHQPAISTVAPTPIFTSQSAVARASELSQSVITASQSHTITSGLKLNSYTDSFTLRELSGYLVIIPDQSDLLIFCNQPQILQDTGMKMFTKAVSMYLRHKLTVNDLQEFCNLTSDIRINELQTYITDWLGGIQL